MKILQRPSLIISSELHLKYFIKFLLICVCMCSCSHSTVHIWRSENNLNVSIIPSYHVLSMDQTQINRYSVKCYYPSTYITSVSTVFYYFSYYKCTTFSWRVVTQFYLMNNLTEMNKISLFLFVIQGSSIIAIFLTIMSSVTHHLSMALIFDTNLDFKT